MRTLAYVLGFILNIMLYGGAREVGGLEFWQAFALLAVLNFAAIVLHELGHAWAFLHVGGSVQKIVVMFLTYDVQKRRLKFSNRLIGSDIGGYVAGRYANDRPTVREIITVAAAGPLANVVSGTLVLMAALALIAVTQAPPAEVVIAGVPPTGTPMANLPSAEVMEQVFAEVDSHQWHRKFRDVGHTALMLFGPLSLGLAVLNLLPYGGSDGQSIARAIKQWRMMGGGRRR